MRELISEILKFEEEFAKLPYFNAYEKGGDQLSLKVAQSILYFNLFCRELEVCPEQFGIWLHNKQFP